MAVNFDPDAVLWFDSPADFGAWLAANHDSAAEMWLGQWKKRTGRQTITWSESVDEALCWGWIDSVAYRIDDERRAQRFSPRRPSSVWSNINVEKVAALTDAGRMQPPGLAAFEARRADRSGIYSFEQEAQELSPEQTKEFRENRAAWTWFESQPPGYRRSAIHWVVSAKKPETRERRLATLVDDSANELRLKHLARNKRP